MAKRPKPNNSSNHCTFYIDGMHCSACEILIEKKLLEEKGVKTATVSLKSKKVVINYTGSQKPDIAKLNKEFKPQGYSFSTQKISKPSHPLISTRDGKLMFNVRKLKDLTKLLLITISFIVAFFVFENLSLGKYVSVDSASTLPAFFLLGLTAGVSSCAALVGGLLLSLTKQWNELFIDSNSRLEKAKPHLMFHIGRILSFAVLGGLLGLIGEVISLNATFFSILTVAVSILMVILALQMLGVGWANKFKLAAPKALTSFVSQEKNFRGKYMPFVIGMLTFILPCGFTLLAQSLALASGSVVKGGLIMVFFSLGTLIPLAAISISGLLLNSKPQLSAKFNIVAGIIIIFLAIYNINGQLNVLGLPSLSNISLRKTESEVLSETDIKTQALYVTAAGFEYIPTSSMTIKAGIPTTLIVDNQGLEGCATYMAATGLLKTFVPLKPGINEIDLGEPKKGTYKLTCSMGMVKPIIITVK